MAKVTEVKIKRQIAKLRKQLEVEMAKGRQQIIKKLVARMREFDISVEEVAAGFGKKRAVVADGAKRSRSVKKARKVAPRYRHPETGATWTGRGRAPRWIVDHEANGGTRGDFSIIASGATDSAHHPEDPVQTPALD